MLKKIGMTVAAFAVSAGSLAHAGTFPDRPIRMIVPYSAGGGTDTLARVIGRAMSEELGQTVLVDNRPGSGTMIGASEVARATPDGYTLLWGDNTTFALNPHLYEKLPYDPISDFSPVSQTIRASLTLVANPATGIRSVQELIDFAKANPGKLQYASAGNGTPHHQAMELLKLKTGINAMHVPYKGEGPALNDVLAGFVSVMFVGNSIANPNVKAGKLNALAFGDSIRNRSLPTVPTVKEAGVSGYEYILWQGIVAPAGTPKDVISKIHSAYAKATTHPDVTGFVEKMGTGVGFIVTEPEDFSSFMKEEREKAGLFVKAINLKIE